MGLVTIDLSGTKVEKVGDSAFFGCLELKEVKLPDCLAVVGNAFEWLGVVTVDL